MSHPNRRRGFGYERELVNQAKDAGLSAERAWGSDGKSLGEDSEVDLKVAGKRIQAKRRKKLASYLQPSAEVDAVAVRQDRGETLVILKWEEYLGMLQEIENNVWVGVQ